MAKEKIHLVISDTHEVPIKGIYSDLELAKATGGCFLHLGDIGFPQNFQELLRIYRQMNSKEFTGEIEQEIKNSFIMIPGNHDLGWENYTYLLKTTPSQENIGEFYVKKTIETNLQHYQTYLKLFETNRNQLSKKGPLTIKVNNRNIALTHAGLTTGKDLTDAFEKRLFKRQTTEPKPYAIYETFEKMKEKKIEGLLKGHDHTQYLIVETENGFAICSNGKISHYTGSRKADETDIQEIFAKTIQIPSARFILNPGALCEGQYALLNETPEKLEVKFKNQEK